MTVQQKESRMSRLKNAYFRNLYNNTPIYPTIYLLSLALLLVASTRWKLFLGVLWAKLADHDMPIATIETYSILVLPLGIFVLFSLYINLEKLLAILCKTC